MATNKSDFKMDFDDFNKKFFKLTIKEIPDEFVESVKLEIPKIIEDAIKLEPRAPHKTGHLWRSQKIELPKWIGKKLDAIFGFDTPYAARLHEGMTDWNWTLAGSGPKFLEAKLLREKDKYYANITERVEKKGTIRDIK
jgi:hypothetical protein